MLTVNNIELLQCKTLKVATLNSVTQFFTHQVSPPNAHSRSQGLSHCSTVGTIARGNEIVSVQRQE